MSTHKLKSLIIIIFLLTLTTINVQSGSFHFGPISAIKDRVEEIKANREEDKKKEKLPSIAITSSIASGVSGRLNITTETTNVVKVEFYVDGALEATYTVEPFEFNFDTIQYTDGQHTIEAIAYNTEGQTATAQYSITVDKANGDQSPTIALTAPADSETVSGTVTVAAEASDDNGITKVEFYVDNVLKSTDTDFPYSYSWDTVQYSEGTHIVKAVVYDTVNQITATQSSVTVDNEDNPPTIALSVPADGSTVSGTVTVTVGVSDDKGTSKVEFYVDRILKSTDTDSPYSYNWDTTQYIKGIHTVKAIVYDTALYTAEDQATVTVNNDPVEDKAPTLYCVRESPTTYLSGKQTFKISAQDDKGISKIDIYVDGVLKDTTTADTYSYIWDTTEYSNGTHTLKIIAYDTANQSTIWAASYKVENVSEGKWSTETVDVVGDVYVYSSIAVDSKKNIHISYYDGTNKDLKYAKWTEIGWNIETVDSTGDVGMYTSIALDSNNNPHISYYDATNKDLKYAKWTGAAWNIETVDSTGDLGFYTSLAIDSDNNSHIAYIDSTNKSLKYAKRTGTVWNIETVEEINSSLGYCSIVVDSNNLPHITYFYRGSIFELKYAKWTGAAWSIDTVDPETRGTDRLRCSMDLDSNNIPQIVYSYSEADYGTWKYAKQIEASWSIERMDFRKYGSWYSSIALDNNNNVHIVTIDKHYTWAGTSWSIESGGGRSIAIDSNNHLHCSGIHWSGSGYNLIYSTK